MGIKVSDLKKALEDFPDDAIVSAYEGEGIGLRITHPNGFFGWIDAGPSDEAESVKIEREYTDEK